MDIVGFFLAKIFKIISEETVSFTSNQSLDTNFKLIPSFYPHVNLSRVILCQEVRELHTEYIYIYIFM